MRNLMPLPVSSRSRSVVLRGGRRESEREAGRHDHSCCCCCCLSRKPHSKHTGPLWRRAPVRTVRTPRFVWVFRCLFGVFFFEFWKNFNTTENKRQTIQLQKQRVCAVSSAPQHTDQVSHLPVGTESAALSVAVAGLGEKIRESTRRGEKVI